MIKKVLISGLLGGVTLIILTFVLNAVLGFKSSMDMKQISNEQEVYNLLKENIVEPGRYICNPEVNSEVGFPGAEPVFSVLYSGIGHDAAGSLMFVELIILLIAPIIAAWMLSMTNERILSSYLNKVSFFTIIGLLLAVYSTFSNFGIGNYPLSDSLILAVHNIFVWTIVGLAVAWQMKPEKG
ncbi:MAG: hypothetical protein ABFS35_07880 [Bacteroidota bacterium]